jgi:hypothetical protein
MINFYYLIFEIKRQILTMMAFANPRDGADSALDLRTLLSCSGPPPPRRAVYLRPNGLTNWAWQALSSD